MGLVRGGAQVTGSIRVRRRRRQPLRILHPCTTFITDYNLRKVLAEENLSDLSHRHRRLVSPRTIVLD